MQELTPQQQPEIGNETDKVIGENPVTEGAVQTDSQESDLPQSIKTNSENQVRFMIKFFFVGAKYVCEVVEFVLNKKKQVL